MGCPFESMIASRLATDTPAFLVFIEPRTEPPKNVRMVQRLDGIWFKPDQFESHNKLIRWVYDRSDYIIWQSEFDKQMTTTHWGERNGSVIRNGIDVRKRSVSQQSLMEIRKRYEKVFVCSASWHRQKRLSENVELFNLLRQKYESACLIIMGGNPDVNVQDPDVFYTGNIYLLILTTIIIVREISISSLARSKILYFPKLPFKPFFSEEFIKEIKSTLKEEKSNNFDGHQDEDYNKGWIEALEYVINTYNHYNNK